MKPVVDLPQGPFTAILADPPWSYYNDSNLQSPRLVREGSMKYPPYPVMSSKDIAALPVKNIADKDSILFIWSTDYHLARCVEIMKSWGFDYKTVGFVLQKLTKSGTPFGRRLRLIIIHSDLAI